MGWLFNFLTSSIGQKLVMSLTGLFLVLFLVVHLAGNFQLLYQDGGEAFNMYTELMTNNAFIQFTSKGLYAFIIIHTIQGLLLAYRNKLSRGGSKYKVKTSKNASFASKNMALLGTLVLFFLFIHLGDFWYKLKFTDSVAMVSYGGVEVRDAFSKVALSFSKWYIVLAYLIGCFVLFLHLKHGFASAFQSLGLNHKKYTPFIKTIGTIYSIVIPIGFAVIPLYFFFK